MFHAFWRQRAALVGAAGLLLACSGLLEPDLTNPVHIRDGAVNFDIPGNWAHRPERQDGAVPVTFWTIDTLNDGVVLVHVFGSVVDAEPPRFMDKLQAEIDDLTPSAPTELTRTISGSTRKGLGNSFLTQTDGRTEKVDVDIWVVHGDTATVAVVSTFPVQSRPKDQPGFDLILDSLQVN